MAVEDMAARQAAKAAEAAEAAEPAEAAARKAAKKAAKAAKASEADGAAPADGDAAADAPADKVTKAGKKERAEKRKAAGPTFAAFKAERLGGGAGKANQVPAGEKSEKKKRKREASEGKPAPEKPAEKADGEKKKKKGKRGKRKKADADKAEELPADAPEEDRRRLAQRDVQQLVLRLQKEGKGKHEINDAKVELKRSQGNFRQEDSMKAKKIKLWHEWVETEDGQKSAAATEEEKKKQENKERKHDIVVIPVVWRNRHDDESIEKAAEDIKACLAQQGLDVWIDSTRQRTPGQKFAHWEHRGVMLRIEIGPEDMKAGICQVCKAAVPGEYKTVEKKKVRLPPRGTRHLLLQLKEFGLSQIDIERRKGDSDSEGEEDPSEAAKKAAEVDEEFEGNFRLSARPPKDGKKYKA